MNSRKRTLATTVFAAALALFLPLGRPLPVGLTPAVGIGAVSKS